MLLLGLAEHRWEESDDVQNMHAVRCRMLSTELAAIGSGARRASDALCRAVPGAPRLGPRPMARAAN